MGPGIPNPILWGGGDPLDELGKIERSVRFRSSASSYFTKTFTSQDDTWTAHFWIKRAETNAVQTIVGSRYASGQIGVINIENDALKCANSGSGSNAISTALYRDYSAFLPVTVTAVAGGLRKIYVEDTLVASASAGAAPFLFTNTAGYVNTIGRYGDSASNYLGAYLANFIYVAGRELPPSTFGLRNTRTGQWRPRSKASIRAAVAIGGGTRNGWGNNGFFLTFDDTSSVTALGYDRSQSDSDTTGNNWTPVNISLTSGTTYDSTPDTPTDNCCVLNQLDKHAGIAVSQGGLYAALSTNIAGTGAVKGSISVSYGKWFWELTTGTIPSGRPYMSVGIAPSQGINVSTINTFGFGSTNESYAYLSASGNKMTGGVSSAYGAAWPTTGVVIGVALDLDNGTLEFFRNGVSQGVAFTGISGSFAPAIGLYTDPASSPMAMNAYANFGQQPFVYEPPAGFKPLSFKNLIMRYPVMKSTASFITKVDSGANIRTTLEASSSWDKWIRIYKRRDATEGWRWQFWDDPDNYLDSSGNGAKAAFPTLVGTSYIGYAIKVSAQNGVATGRLVHTSGAADILLDGLANSKKTILLKNEATGSWFWYHPNLTAGKLLYLDDSTLGETTDGTISSITSSGFTVASTLASGTYRWIAFADTPGFLAVGGFTTNGVADGPFMHMGISPALALFRLKQSGDLPILDAVRNPTNLANSVLYLDGTDPETSPSTINNGDLISNGFKSRCATSAPEDINYNSGTGGIYVAFGQPFRYSNAR